MLEWKSMGWQVAGLVASGRGQDPLLFDLGAQTYSTISMANEGAPLSLSAPGASPRNQAFHRASSQPACNAAPTICAACPAGKCRSSSNVTVRKEHLVASRQKAFLCTWTGDLLQGERYVDPATIALALFCAGWRSRGAETLCFNPTGELLLFGPTLWDPRAPRCLHVFDLLSYSACCSSFHPSGLEAVVNSEVCAGSPIPEYLKEGRGPKGTPACFRSGALAVPPPELPLFGRACPLRPGLQPLSCPTILCLRQSCMPMQMGPFERGVRVQKPGCDVSCVVLLVEQVWDLRTLKLQRCVPCLDSTSLTWNASGDCAFATLRRPSDDLGALLHPKRAKHPLHAAFRTVNTPVLSRV